MYNSVMELYRAVIQALVVILVVNGVAFVPILRRSAGPALPDLPAAVSRSDDAMDFQQLLGGAMARSTQPLFSERTNFDFLR